MRNILPLLMLLLSGCLTARIGVGPTTDTKGNIGGVLQVHGAYGPGFDKHHGAFVGVTGGGGALTGRGAFGTMKAALDGVKIVPYREQEGGARKHLGLRAGLRGGFVNDGEAQGIIGGALGIVPSMKRGRFGGGGGKSGSILSATTYKGVGLEIERLFLIGEGVGPTREESRGLFSALLTMEWLTLPR